MAQRLLIFDPRAVLNLLIHYDDGHTIPLGAEVREVRGHPTLNRYVALVVESDHWPDDRRYIEFSYEGRRVMKFKLGEEPMWTDAPEGPKVTLK